jgi:hypothetical protein
MKKEEHEQQNIEMFGHAHKNVGEWLDRFYAVFGVRHRIILHHRKGINLLIQEIPGPVRKVAEEHIISDLGEIPDGPDWLYFDLDRQYADKYRIKNGHENHDPLAVVLEKLYGVQL